MPDLVQRHGETFEGETLILDGKDWRDCTFINCTLVYKGGPLRFNESTLEETAFSFRGAAARTITFLANVNATGGEKAVDDVIEVIQGK